MATRSINEKSMLAQLQSVLTIRFTDWFLFIAAVLLLLPANSVFSQNTDYLSVKELIDRNREDIEFIDVFLTDLDLNETPASEIRKSVVETYTEAIRRDFFANMYYLRGDYGRAFSELVRSRRNLRDVYRALIEYYHDTSEILLEQPAIRILRTNDAMAEHYLRSGYRHAKKGFQLSVRATGTRDNLIGDQINLYTQAFREVMLARKYAILAIMESVTPRAQKESTKYVSLDDYKNDDRIIKVKKEEYIDTRKKLQSLIGVGLIDQKVETKSRGYLIRLDLLKVHRENYFKYHPDRESLFFMVGMNLNTTDFQRINQLPVRNRKNRNEIPAEESDPPDLTAPE